MFIKEYKYYFESLIEYSKKYIERNCTFRGSFEKVLDGKTDPHFNYDYKYYCITKCTKMLMALPTLLEIGNYEDVIILSRTMLECYLSQRYFDDKFDMNTLRDMVIIPTAINNGYLNHYGGKVTRGDTGETVEFNQRNPSDLCIGKDGSFFYSLYYFMCENAHCNISQAYAFLDNKDKFILESDDNLEVSHILPLFVFTKLFESIVLLEYSKFDNEEEKTRVKDFFVDLTTFVYNKLDDFSRTPEVSSEHHKKLAVKTFKEMKNSFKEQLGFVEKTFITELEKQHDETSIEKALKPALLESTQPTLFFENLRTNGKLCPRYAELNKLIGLPQNPVYHPEGDVWTHTMQALDRAVAFRDKVSDPYSFMLLVLCHDLGKSVTTKEVDGVIHSYEHEVAGVEIAEKFLRRITNSIKVRKYVLEMIPLHMKCAMYASDKSSEKATNKLFSSVQHPEDLIYFAKCDKILSEEDERFLWERLALSATK